MSVPAVVYPQGACAGNTVPAWNGTALTLTAGAGGAFIASFGGQAYANLNVPLPGWPQGNAS